MEPESRFHAALEEVELTESSDETSRAKIGARMRKICAGRALVKR